jgi:hypothetical protein
MDGIHVTSADNTTYFGVLFNCLPQNPGVHFVVELYDDAGCTYRKEWFIYLRQAPAVDLPFVTTVQK